MQVFDEKLRRWRPVAAAILQGEDGEVSDEQARQEVVGLWGLVLRLRRAAGASALVGRAAASLADVVSVAVTEATVTVGAERAALFVFDSARDELWTVRRGIGAAGTLSEIRVPAASGVAGWVARHARPALVEDAHADPRFSSETDTKLGIRTRSLVTVPVIDPAASRAAGAAAGRSTSSKRRSRPAASSRGGSRRLSGEGPALAHPVIGVLQVANRRGGEAFTALDVVMLGLLAAQLAPALQRVAAGTEAQAEALGLNAAAAALPLRLAVPLAPLAFGLSPPALPDALASQLTSSAGLGASAVPPTRVDFALAWVEHAEQCVAHALGVPACRVFVVRSRPGAARSGGADLSLHSSESDRAGVPSGGRLWWSCRDLTTAGQGKRSLGGLRRKLAGTKARERSSGLVAAAMGGGGARGGDGALQQGMESAAARGGVADDGEADLLWGRWREAMPTTVRSWGADHEARSLAGRAAGRVSGAAQVLGAESSGRSLWFNGAVDVDAGACSLVVAPCVAEVGLAVGLPGVSPSGRVVTGVLQLGVLHPTAAFVRGVELVAQQLGAALLSLSALDATALRDE